MNLNFLENWKAETYTPIKKCNMAKNLLNNEPAIPIEDLKLQHEMNTLEFLPYFRFFKGQKPLKNHTLRKEFKKKGYVEIYAPKGRPAGVTIAYHDVILIEFLKNKKQNPVFTNPYYILKEINLEPSGGNYRFFLKNMEKLFTLHFKSDRFYDRKNKKVREVTYFRIFEAMGRAEYNGKENQCWFRFSKEYVDSFRAGYVKTLDTGFCLELDREKAYFERYLFGYLKKKIGKVKPDWKIELDNFLHSVGLGHYCDKDKKRKNESVKRIILPALERIKGKAFKDYTLKNKVLRFTSATYKERKSATVYPIQKEIFEEGGKAHRKAVKISGTGAEAQGRVGIKEMSAEIEKLEAAAGVVYKEPEPVIKESFEDKQRKASLFSPENLKQIKKELPIKLISALRNNWQTEVTEIISKLPAERRQDIGGISRHVLEAAAFQDDD
jgi:hypothetical protein